MALQMVRASPPIVANMGCRDAAPLIRGSLAVNFAWSDFNYGRELEESGNLEARHAGNPAGQVLHLVGEFFIDPPGGFVDRRSDQILQHLLVFVGENVGLDAYINKLLLPIHFYGNHAAAGRGFHGYGVYLTLQVFLQLLEPGEHLLERVDFHQDSSGLRFTSVIFPPKRCSIDFTTGSRSNWARKSCVPDPPRDAEAAAAATASSLAQTRTGRPSTLLETPRSFSSESRPSSISANVRAAGEK